MRKKLYKVYHEDIERLIADIMKMSDALKDNVVNVKSHGIINSICNTNGDPIGYGVTQDEIKGMRKALRYVAIHKIDEWRFNLYD